jgi:hypothetical protein
MRALVAYARSRQAEKILRAQFHFRIGCVDFGNPLVGVVHNFLCRLLDIANTRSVTDRFLKRRVGERKL